MAKVIIRSEVNALVEGVFTTDLSKAVLYGELSGDSRFVVSATNSVSNLPYTTNQALLDADIRTASQLVVTLTPRQNTVLSTGMTLIFDISTGGTASVGTPVWSVVTARVGGNDVRASISGTELSLTVPANSTYSSKAIEARVKVEIDGNEFQSNLANATQNAAGLLQFSASTQTVHSTATTATQKYGTNCTNVGVYSASTDTTAQLTGTTQVKATFPMNTGSTQVSRTVTISGKTPDNTIIYDTHTINQSSAVTTNFTATYNGGDVSASGATIPTSSFTLSLTNASLTGVSASGISVTTGGTATNPTLTVTVPANQSNDGRSYTITLTAKDVYNRTITQTITIGQDSDAYTFSVSPNPQTAGANDTAATVSVTATNIRPDSIGVSSTSGMVTGTTYNSGTLTINFPVNSGVSGTSGTTTLTGTTIGGRNVSVTATINQGGQGYSPSITPATTSVTLAAYVEGAYNGDPVSGSVNFTYTDLSGYTVAKTSNIETATVSTGSTNTVRFTIDQNETTSAISPVGTITLTGKGQGGTDVTLVITVNQAAGVDPTMGLVNSPQSLAANATSATDQINYNYIDPNSIARTTMTGNISSVTIS